MSGVCWFLTHARALRSGFHLRQPLRLDAAITGHNGGMSSGCQDHLQRFDRECVVD
jgi:hypothetical protein